MHTLRVLRLKALVLVPLVEKVDDYTHTILSYKAANPLRKSTSKPRATYRAGLRLLNNLRAWGYYPLMCSVAVGYGFVTVDQWRAKLNEMD